MTNYDILKEYEAHQTPVPSYEEWQALKASYEMSTDANLEQATWMVDMEKENAQLKELLKECFIAINEGSYFDQCDILKKIDEALK